MAADTLSSAEDPVANAEKWDLRTLLAEQDKWRRLQLDSVQLRKRLFVPSVDVQSNPFCPDRQLLDSYELRQLNRNPRLYRQSHARATEGKRLYAASGLHTASPRGYVDGHPKEAARTFVRDVRKVAAEPLAALRRTASMKEAPDTADFGRSGRLAGTAGTAGTAAGRTAGSRRRRAQDKPAVLLDAGNIGTFGHRRASASLHLDALTLTANREALSSVPAPLPHVTDARGAARSGLAAALMTSDDLSRLLRGDVEASAALAVKAPILTAKDLFERAVALGDSNNIAARAGAAGALPPHWNLGNGSGSSRGVDSAPSESAHAPSPRSVSTVEAVEMRALDPSGTTLDTVHFSVQAAANAPKLFVAGTGWDAVCRPRMPKFQTSAFAGPSTLGTLADAFEEQAMMEAAVEAGRDDRRIDEWRATHASSVSHLPDVRRALSGPPSATSVGGLRRASPLRTREDTFSSPPDSHGVSREHLGSSPSQPPLPGSPVSYDDAAGSQSRSGTAAEMGVVAPSLVRDIPIVRMHARARSFADSRRLASPTRAANVPNATDVEVAKNKWREANWDARLGVAETRDAQRIREAGERHRARPIPSTREILSRYVKRSAGIPDEYLLNAHKYALDDAERERARKTPYGVEAKFDEASVLAATSEMERSLADAASQRSRLSIVGGSLDAPQPDAANASPTAATRPGSSVVDSNGVSEAEADSSAAESEFNRGNAASRPLPTIDAM